MKKETKSKANPTTCIIAFKVEDHISWRIGIFPTKEKFEQYLLGAMNHPKITEKKWFIFDKITGKITEEK